MKKLIIPWVFVMFFITASFMSAHAGPVPDTGQTGDYTATWGEDSDYDINPHSYTDLGNGIVRDNVTGLEWVQDGNLMATRDPGFDTNGEAGDGAVVWQKALDYIEKLNNENYLFYNDWRLPTVKELSYLCDSSTYGPSINTTFFPGTEEVYYSSTTAAGYINSVYTVRFRYATVGTHAKSVYLYVRAVRAGQCRSLDNLVINGDGTVTDNATGLMWQQATAPGTYIWEEALVYCEGLELAGYSDWRLPNRNELQSIVDYSTYSPSIDTTFFPGTEVSGYWSSTTDAYNTSCAWFVSFFHGNLRGNMPNFNKSNYSYVRAVRAGQCGSFGDSDLDGICDDGDASCVPGDNPCTSGNTVFCDDNCPDDANSDQADEDADGEGDVCDETLIELSAFEAVAGNREASLIWKTASEIDNAGFNLYRTETEDGEYVQINNRLIPAKGSPTEGAEYEFADEDVENRQAYWYMLEDVDLNGVSTVHGPVSATPRLICGIGK